MSILIYQHLGLGDHFICNGLVREICASHPKDELEIITKPTHFETVKFMFWDVPNLKVVKLRSGNFAMPENSGEVNDYARMTKQQVLKIGHEFMRTDINFDQAFYAQFNLDFETRWSSFKIIRDVESEKRRINDCLNIREKYIFVQDDPDRRMEIKKELLPSGIRIIRPILGMTNNMIDYMSLIEGAEEIHCIESSFMFMIDSFQINKPLIAHRYARTYPANNAPTLKLPWKILT